MSGFRPKKETLDRVPRCLLPLEEKKKRVFLPVSHISNTPTLILSLSALICDLPQNAIRIGAWAGLNIFRRDE